jgi:DNA-directed RNA polymerase subunit RPC12/RpoP
VSDDDVRLQMSMPLDSGGFLRRECPTCQREFKWLHTPEGEGTAAPVADGGYFCPYCGVQAQTNTWLTEAQVELAQNIVATQAIGPMLKKFGDSLTYHPPDELDPLTEVDDMTRVDFECHPTEPVKVLDTWDKPVRCLICGRPNF